MQRLKTKFKKATSTRKGKIVAATLFVVIVAAIGGGILYWNAHKKRIIRNEIESAIRKKTKGLYLLKYDSLSLDEVAGDLRVTNLQLSYDSTKYVALEKTNDAPPVLLTIQIPSLEVSGVKTPRALLDKEIVGKIIHIRNPVIQILYTNAGKDSLRTVPTKEVYEQILGNLNMIKVDTVEISGAQIITRTLRTGKENLQVQNTFVRLIDVAVDSAASKDSNRLLFSKQIQLSAEKIAWSSANGLYQYFADSVLLNSATSKAYVKRFQIEPTLNENAFVRSLPTQDDRFDFSINGVRLEQLQMQELLNENIIADSLIINASSFRIYRDLSIRRDKKNRVGTYPHQALEKLPIPIRIKKLVLANSFVEYKEKNPRTNQAGKVQFQNVYAVLTNFTNIKEAVKENNIMTADISAKFLNRAPLDITWKFYLEHPRGRFDIKGKLGAIPFTDVNSLTVPMGPAKMEDGNLKSLRFDFDGNDYAMNGTVQMLYEDLKISVLEKDEDKKKLDKKTIASIAANIVIKNSNPSNEKEEPRSVKVDMPRDTNRSIFYLIWKSLFKGVKESTGIKK